MYYVLLILLTYCSEIRNVFNNERTNAWLGISDSGSEGTWKFTNGERASNMVFSWYPGEPNNSDNNEDCACLSHNVYYPNHILQDLPCQYHRRVMCQFPTGNC